MTKNWGEKDQQEVNGPGIDESPEYEDGGFPIPVSPGIMGRRVLLIIAVIAAIVVFLLGVKYYREHQAKQMTGEVNQWACERTSF